MADRSSKTGKFTFAGRSSETYRSLDRYGTSATGSHIEVAALPPYGRPRSKKNVENAIYGYIRAVRALGRTEITTAQVAAALKVPEAEVINSMASLKRKGVKVL